MGCTTSSTATVQCVKKLEESIELLRFMQQLISQPTNGNDTPLAFLEASQDVRQIVDSAVHLALRPALAGGA